MVIAQITDTHIRRKGRPLYGVIDTAKHLRRCIEHVNRLEPRPDVVLATGDLTDGGKPKEYRRLRKLLDEVAAPVLVIPGNHDDREGLRAEFSDYPHVAATGRYFQYVVDDYPVRLIALDSTEPGRPGGFLDDARLDWLAARLAERRDRPTLVFMHHPPFQTGIRAMDALGFIGVERFGEIIERCGHVERIVAGHKHSSITRGRYGGASW